MIIIPIRIAPWLEMGGIPRYHSPYIATAGGGCLATTQRLPLVLGVAHQSWSAIVSGSLGRRSAREALETRSVSDHVV